MIARTEHQHNSYMLIILENKNIKQQHVHIHCTLHVSPHTETCKTFSLMMGIISHKRSLVLTSFGFLTDFPNYNQYNNSCDDDQSQIHDR